MAAYPADFAERYRLAGYWIGQTHTDLLRSSAAEYSSNVAVTDSRRNLTYGDLQDQVARLANGFVAAGWQRGGRVVVQMPNVVEFLEVTFALFDAGMVPVFALASHGRAEVLDLVDRSQAVAYITVDAGGATDYGGIADAVTEMHPDLDIVVARVSRGGSATLPRSAALLDEFRSGMTETTGRSGAPDDIAFLQLSGGTTGTPKLIPRTHDDYLYSVRESAEIAALTCDSVFGVVLPVSHNFTMSSPGVLGAIHAGATIVMIGSSDPDTVFRTIAAKGITHLSAVPPLVAAWLDSPARSQYDLGSLRVLQVGGAKLSRALAKRIPDAFAVTLQQVFGMAEGLVNYTRLEDDLETICSTQGRPISPADEIRIVDTDGAPVPDGVPGSLQVRGPYTIRGYWAGQAADSFTDDGFYCSGDIVVRDSRGYLTVVGREKDQINRGGEKIAPEEIENMLLSHPAIRDASVIGVADERLGEKIVVYLIPSGAAVNPPDEYSLRRYMREQGLARFKLPDEIYLVDEFPTTAVGKISKNVQRSMSNEAQRGNTSGDRGATGHADLDDLQILTDLADKLGIDAGTLDGSMVLADTGIDSLALMALLDKWRALGSSGLEFEALVAAQTVDDLIAAVTSAGRDAG